MFTVRGSVAFLNFRRVGPTTQFTDRDFNLTRSPCCDRRAGRQFSLRSFG